MNNYITMYANQFNLKLVTDSKEKDLMFYDKDRLVSYIEENEPGFFHYCYNDKWNMCKVTDLALLILNNTSAHG